ncbi:hypothetical protein [Aestuariivirga sp.]|uniref:hypothetical protein n=1 Tax=Aestuariivirga sp. TaxID=2650926 RepID=UPI0039E3E04F
MAEGYTPADARRVEAVFARALPIGASLEVERYSDGAAIAVRLYRPDSADVMSSVMFGYQPERAATLGVQPVPADVERIAARFAEIWRDAA